MKKVTIICLVLVLCLGAIGIGYAKWFETLNINGTINTGEVDAELSIHECGDSEPPEKDVSFMNCQLDPQNPKVLWVTLENAYPCIEYWCIFDIHNTGTIPVKVELVDLDRGNLPPSAFVEAGGLTYGLQIEPGEAPIFTLRVHLFNEGTEENATYTFSVLISVAQWNEVP